VLTVFACLILAPQGFYTVPAGRYQVGKADRYDNPLRFVRLRSYQIARTETTNAQFAAFVAATGYVTDAQKRHNAMVFEPPLKEFRWIRDASAYWRFPNGVKRGDLAGKDQHPVTSISYYDALQYCKWAKVRLPTLEEWEVACRAGTRTDYFFGDTPAQIGKYANVWHGRDHLKADASDGYEYTSPVGSFAPNPWGLYDMYGNVFEFCTGHVASDPAKSDRVIHSRGGSWWCSKNSCCFFNSVDIGRTDIHASFSNQGFRVVKG